MMVMMVMMLMCFIQLALHLLGEHVHAYVGVALEEAGLAHLLQADAAGRDVGHAPGCELDARIRDVGPIGQDGHADGLDRDNLGVYWVEDMLLQAGL